MSLAQITEKIERDARAEADKILARAAEQEAGIIKETADEVEQLNAAADERFRVERPEIFRRRNIVASLDVKKLLLHSQRKLIDDVYDGALSQLKALDKDKYLAFCEKLLKSATDGSDELMEISAEENHIDLAWLDQFNEKHGTKIKLSDKRRNIAGGFMLVRGRICINCSWNMLIQVARETLETELVKRLFPC